MGSLYNRNAKDRWNAGLEDELAEEERAGKGALMDSLWNRNSEDRWNARWRAGRRSWRRKENWRVPSDHRGRVVGKEGGTIQFVHFDFVSLFSTEPSRGS